MKIVKLLVILLVAVACSDDGDEPTISVPKSGDIIGSVNLHDEGETQIDDSNMTVKVEGKTISATTNDKGEFRLEDVAFGTLTLIYEKSGYGTYKRINITHKDGTANVVHKDGAIITYQDPYLGEISTTQVINLEAEVKGDVVKVSIRTNPEGSTVNTRYIRYFLSTDSNVSSDNYSYSSPGLIKEIDPLEFDWNDTRLVNAGFSSGETVYLKVYGESFWSNEYEDPSIDSKVFPNLNAISADAVSFVVP